ncbi:MAG: hypothetical protein Q4E13_00425 [Clostridia bacterium]|nr:hypothetical protein [Clostridia bacterium]
MREDRPARAARLTDMVWLRDRRLFPEVREVLGWFRENGYRIGVISDTLPSLRLTLEALGLGEFLDACVCSDEVGV